MVILSAAFTNAEKELWTLLMSFVHLLKGTTSVFYKDTAHTQIKKTVYHLTRSAVYPARLLWQIGASNGFGDIGGRDVGLLKYNKTKWHLNCGGQSTKDIYI